ncbi:hypothetical membrane protein [Thermococcus chitonophagus]|uniref:Hypothetical membrane protein n=1 Tax=Thermococcus chitonophagus TaxID=54262 RepID=A0A160VQ42_9EURY|nr:hypothetical membrane protein [Thermococcus chitonophagus]
MLGLTASYATATADLVSRIPDKSREVQPQNVGAVVGRVLTIFIPGVGWVVIIGTIATIIATLARYLYGKPVAEFIEGFISEIPDKQGNLVQVTKTNIWGSEAEIGYGYVREKWWGLKKEVVIVNLVIRITRDEVKAVEDLFSPKEYGKLLAQAWLNGWDANKAKEFAEELYRELEIYQNSKEEMHHVDTGLRGK